MRIVITSGPLAGRAIDVDRELLLGRVHPVDVLIEDPRVSGRHALIRPTGDGIQIEDIGSSNGTFVRGQRIAAPCELVNGDEVRVGDTTLRVEGAPTTVAGGEAPTGWTLAVRTGPDVGSVAELGSGTITIGRDDSADMVLTDSRVSNRHAQLSLRGETATVTDLGSANGTLVDGAPVTGEVAIRSGAEIQLGETVIVATRGEAAVSGPAPTVIGGAIPAELTATTATGRTRPVLVGASVAGVVAVGALVFALTRGDGALTPAQVVKKNRSATVMVLSKVNGELSSMGSGFVVDAGQGLIVTNNHVATGGDLSVQPEAARTLQSGATIVAAMPCEDLALVKVEDPALRAAVRSVTFSNTTYEQGDPVVALGYPGSAESGRDFGKDTMSATSGIVSKVLARYDVPMSGVPLLTSVIQHTAAVNPGNSGGPLFDDHGELVGVNTAIYSRGGQRAESESYAVSETRLREKLELLKSGNAQHWLGLSLGSTLRNSAGDPAGVAVEGVTPDSPAGRAGVRAGLALIAVNRRTVFDTQSYCESVPADEGATVTLTFQDLDTNEQADLQLTVGNG